MKSLDTKTGRCAILFPHGVLFRDEEREMREKLVKSDLVECVIGIGKNLFFNSPMEACIIICRTEKEHSRKGRVLFINAKNEVTRKNAESYLEEDHIQKIAQTYINFKEEEGFSSIATISEILGYGSKLSIPLYVSGSGASEDQEVSYTVEEAIDDWLNSSDSFRESYDTLKYMIFDNGGEEC